MTCSSCKYLVETDKKEGALCGAKYYCTKTGCYVDGSSDKCNIFEKSYTRKNYTCNDIYNEGRMYSDDDKPVSFYIIVLILILVLGSILRLIGG